MHLKTSQAIRSLGTTYYRLISALRCGKLPPPAKDCSGDFIWTPKDIENARRALAVDLRRRKREAVTA
jgi:hypothetical protein